MNRFKYFICERDLINMAHGKMKSVEFFPRNPKQCPDSFCDLNNILEVYITVVDPNKDDTKPRMDKKRSIRSRLPKSNR